MAKLYTELTSDKSARIASKGGDEYVNVKLRAGNRILGHIELRHHNDGTVYVRWYDSQKPFNEKDRCKVLQITNIYKA